ncbi:MAG: pyridoxamine 5'-phosphate oxidase family protein [Actinomycetota bacterium]
MRQPPRSRAERHADTLARLETEVDCWVASADERGNAYLVPLSFYWDGTALVLATPRASTTAANLLRAGVARVGVGPTRDVVLVDGVVSDGVDDATADAHTRHTGFDARGEPGDYAYLRIVPTEIRAWREANELAGRLLMRDGEWLPLDA